MYRNGTEVHEQLHWLQINISLIWTWFDALANLWLSKAGLRLSYSFQKYIVKLDFQFSLYMKVVFGYLETQSQRNATSGQIQHK